MPCVPGQVNAPCQRIEIQVRVGATQVAKLRFAIHHLLRDSRRSYADSICFWRLPVSGRRQRNTFLTQRGLHQLDLVVDAGHLKQSLHVLDLLLFAHAARKHFVILMPLPFVVTAQSFGQAVSSADVAARSSRTMPMLFEIASLELPTITLATCRQSSRRVGVEANASPLQALTIFWNGGMPKAAQMENALTAARSPLLEKSFEYPWPVSSLVIGQRPNTDVISRIWPYAWFS